MLAVEGGALATFTALDLLLFFVAFETVLVPMWFVIALWGDDRQPAGSRPPRLGGEAARRDAANRFVLYTALGSAVMLLGIAAGGVAGRHAPTWSSWPPAPARACPPTSRCSRPG